MVTPTAQHESIHREIRQKMKRYVDPRTGTISFSGADMTAVVFLPMSTNQLSLLITKKKKELGVMRSDLARFRAAAGGYEVGSVDGLTLLDLAEKINVANEEVLRLESLGKECVRYTRPVKLFDLQTLSISHHREKFPVRTLGRVHAKSHTRGPRTIAGSFIFTLFNKAALWDLLEATSNFYSTGVGINGTDSAYPEMSTVLADQLPPFDITIMCSNELGDNSYMVLYGVEIVNEGITLSIQDIITEDVMQFVARDFDPMRPLTKRRQMLQRVGDPIISVDNRLEQLRTERERRGIRLNPYV